jgi:fatty-acyl-CoA synthase
MIDEEGYIHIVGRKKDMIIRGGQNIYPAKIESHLTMLTGIREAAVVGVPDDMGTERVWAFVIVEDGARLTERVILDHCRARLEAYEIPEHVRIVGDFPRTSSGKAQKYKLRDIAMEEVRTDA